MVVSARASASGRRGALVALLVATLAVAAMSELLVGSVEHAAHALDPPRVTVGLHALPVVERVAPQLPRLGERIGRNA